MGVEGVTGQRTVNPLIVSIGDVSLLTHEGPALRLGSEEERSHIRVKRVCRKGAVSLAWKSLRTVGQPCAISGTFLPKNRRYKACGSLGLSGFLTRHAIRVAGWSHSLRDRWLTVATQP
jgi:hypothetical protein